MKQIDVRRWSCAAWALAGCLFATQLAWAQQTTRRSSSSSSTDYGKATEVGGAMISSDSETRRLIVVTDDETAQHIGQIITNLDRAVPQVLIKVLFLEVTYRDGMDLGVEASYTWKQNRATGTVLENFNGMSGITSGNGIVNLVGSDFQATLRAIAENGKLEVLSRPTILARNNQEAVITVGQQVPLITNVRYDNFGNQINAITYQDVGIILRVTPFVTSDNQVEMIVNPEISNLSDEKVSVSTGTNSVGAPVINMRSADTVVVTPDGQTVVIGGLIQDNKTQSTSKVPVLGDIPLLGAAFRRKVTANSKTELLIFLTPRIVKHPSELASLASQESSNARLLPKSFSEQDLDRALDRATAPAESPPPTKKKKK